MEYNILPQEVVSKFESGHVYTFVSNGTIHTGAFATAIACHLGGGDYQIGTGATGDNRFSSDKKCSDYDLLITKVCDAILMQAGGTRFGCEESLVWLNKTADSCETIIFVPYNCARVKIEALTNIQELTLEQRLWYMRLSDVSKSVVYCYIENDEVKLEFRKYVRKGTETVTSIALPDSFKNTYKKFL